MHIRTYLNVCNMKLLFKIALVCMAESPPDHFVNICEDMYLVHTFVHVYIHV